MTQATKRNQGTEATQFAERPAADEYMRSGWWARIGDPAIILAAVTAAGYSWAFAYEDGYYGYFGLRPEVLRVSPEWVVYAAFLALMLLFLITVIVTSALTGLRLGERIGRFVGKLLGREEKTSRAISKSWVLRSSRYLLPVLVLAIAVVVVREYPYSLGRHAAMKATEFEVVKGQNLVVLYYLDDIRICAPFDGRTGRVLPEFHYVPVSSEASSPVFIKRRLGPLKPPEIR